ncbi:MULTISPECIES: Hsp20/alpha crystallin family protein [unclassified Dietzia]|uniref:Hsp20/alpha crystallin family protein n=1 Tax=unclassified Dietzia TaxID=2617939 RepID=UPI000D2225E2|nr:MULTISPECIES: Hsp20/alpha crystallin family protein [unclassified Dietzia]AVZ39884.1 heat-shock protein Hsp20 [Dietzia sp. JS16-p6b]MBB1025217.1 Hsp20/alpha crystallin family protein [Dietzia sp. DQ12-76]MBB1028344.1 Hsp20/alpha crystallin family protein [Dietzia sp. DQ11-38-2]QGW25276.1 heat shock protein Hsp20 family protein [Dietzia sp. DQ12-45-1b]
MADNLARFDPFAGLDALRREFLDSGLLGTLRGRAPTTDVYTEGDTGLVVEVHLPNFEEKDISVAVDKGTLSIQAERHERDEDKSRKYVVRESSSSFFRSIALPDHADVQKITADYDDGVLKVTVPLAEISAPTKIQIGSGGSAP